MNKSVPQRIIIDGYNVIYADDSLRKIALRDMNRARVKFLEAIGAYLERKNVRVTVVFDGRGALADAEVIIPGKFQVVYSPLGQTADDLINATLRRSGKPQAYLVVSSDKTHIGSVARSLGCQVLGARAFLKRLYPTADGAEGRGETKSGSQPVDTEFWLDEFEKRDE